MEKILSFFSHGVGFAIIMIVLTVVIYKFFPKEGLASKWRRDAEEKSVSKISDEKNK